MKTVFAKHKDTKEYLFKVPKHIKKIKEGDKEQLMTISIENFGPNNRDKRVGRSLYRISRDDATGKWYIFESYSDEDEWSCYRAYYSDDLQFVIDKINAISKEREIVNMMGGRSEAALAEKGAEQ